MDQQIFCTQNKAGASYIFKGRKWEVEAAFCNKMET